MATVDSFRRLFFVVRVFFRGVSLKTLIRLARAGFNRVFLGRRRPLSAVIGITHRCQCQCPHCLVTGRSSGGAELTAAEIRGVLDFMAGWGVVKATFFGGEPLMREDLPAFVAYASALGLRTSIDTNGILLTEDMVRRLKAAGIGNINVSLDSAEADVHDGLRGNKGCFEAAAGGIRACARLGVPAIVSTYASHRAVNSGDLARLVALSRGLGASGVKILMPILSGRWSGKEEERLSNEEEARLFALLRADYVYIEDAFEMARRGERSCAALKGNMIYISPRGDVQPCPSMPVTFGNIRERPLAAIAASMEGHPFFKAHSACSVCLVNTPDFSKRFLPGPPGDTLADVDEIMRGQDSPLTAVYGKGK